MNGELRAKWPLDTCSDGRPDDAQNLLDTTPVGIDHALLHVVEGRSILSMPIRQGMAQVRPMQHFYRLLFRPLRGH